MEILRAILTSLACAVIIAAAAPLVRVVAWWIRGFDFPRLQFALIGLGVMTAYIFVWDPQSIWQDVVLGLLAAATVWQFANVLPYTRLWRKQVAAGNLQKAATLSLVIANVDFENGDAQSHLRMLEQADADLILALEMTEWWCSQLETLADRYPHVVKRPHGSGYGIMLVSKLPLHEITIRDLTRENVPSIRTEVELEGGNRVLFYGLHPPPPFPGISETSLPRDAELIKVGREVAERDAPSIVAGDLNDVAWSHTTRLFQRISRLLDPRIGRGLFATFHARFFFARWPLDHLFVSKHFRVLELRRLDAGGSDHFPIFASLAFEPQERHAQREPSEETPRDREEAEETLRQEAETDDSIPQA